MKRMNIRFLFVLLFFKNKQVAQTGLEAQQDEQAPVKRSMGGESCRNRDGQTTVLSHPAVLIHMNSSDLCKREFAVSSDSCDQPIR